MGRTACTEPQCLYKGALYFFFYLHNTANNSFTLPVSSYLQAMNRPIYYLYLTKNPYNSPHVQLGKRFHSSYLWIQPTRCKYV